MLFIIGGRSMAAKKRLLHSGWPMPATEQVKRTTAWADAMNQSCDGITRGWPMCILLSADCFDPMLLSHNWSHFQKRNGSCQPFWRKWKKRGLPNVNRY